MHHSADKGRRGYEHLIIGTAYEQHVTTAVGFLSRSRTFAALGAAVVVACATQPTLDETPRPITASPLQLRAATGEELETSRGAGRAVDLELRLARRDESAASGEVTAGPYSVTYLVTPATGYYESDPGVPAALTWHDVVGPGESHLSVVVRDTSDGRLVEGLAVSATIKPRRGRAFSWELPFGWHPVLNRYGENMRLPAGPFALRISIDTAARVGDDDGHGRARAIVASFPSVVLRTGSIEAAAQRVARSDGIEARELAQEEGLWERRAIESMLNGGIAHGQRVRTAGYDVTIAVERPVDAAATDTAHDAYLAMIVQDTASGRAIPALRVRAQMLDADHRVVATRDLDYVRRPWLSHFGAWWRVPQDGRYTFHVHADAPAVRRYGRATGLEFRRGIDVDLPSIRLSTRSESGR